LEGRGVGVGIEGERESRPLFLLVADFLRGERDARISHHSQVDVNKKIIVLIIILLFSMPSQLFNVVYALVV
jgi:hypothetical protein